MVRRGSRRQSYPERLQCLRGWPILRATIEVGQIMRFGGIEEFVKTGARHLAKGPVALIFFEDAAEIDSTLLHHLRLGFGCIVAFTPEGLDLPDPLPARVVQVRLATRAEGAVTGAVNAVAAAAPGLWLYYGFNAEYLFYPFCESRSIREMLAFHAEERRDAMRACVIDLYAGDTDRAPDGVSLADAHLDRIGYYFRDRHGPDGAVLERQPEIFGGLRWRFDQHVPKDRWRIDRVAIFRAKPERCLLEDHRLSETEGNTISCRWHRNLTAAICSFRAAKALRSNPGSQDDTRSFRWHGSEPFAWSSQQLLDLGMMEPGQWF